MIAIIPIIYNKIFYEIIDDEEVYIYIISLILKKDINIIKDNFSYDSKLLFNTYIVKITITRHINVKKVDTTKFKYLEINFVKSSYSNNTIDTKFFDNISIYFINIDVILKQIYNKGRNELNSFERFIVLISTTNKKEMLEVINNKYLYYIYKKRSIFDNRKYESDYNKIEEEIVDFDFYKEEFINNIKMKLMNYLDIETIEEVLDM